MVRGPPMPGPKADDRDAAGEAPRMADRPLVLIIDDEPAIVRLVRAQLVADGYAVSTAGHSAEAVTRLDEERPDLVILDLGMVGSDGVETRLRLRSQAPVLLLTTSIAQTHRHTGLAGGADDALSIPFDPEDLSARVDAVLRLPRWAALMGGPAVLRYPGVAIDLDRRRLTVAGETVDLSRTEWKLLAQLAGQAGQVLPSDELLTRVWGPEFRAEARYLQTWIRRLQAKLDGGSARPALITGVPGSGYSLAPPW